MDPTARFFSRLRKLAVTLESETEKLQVAYENRHNDGDSDNKAKAMRAYHELNCEVGNMKGQIQEQLAQQKAKGSEVSGFIKACRVMEQRVTEDIQLLRAHCEKYGYKAPRDTQRLNKAKDEESVAADEDGSKSVVDEEQDEEEEGGNEEAEGIPTSSSPPPVGPPPFTDALRTPQLSDFGLSELHLKRALAGAEWCSEVPPMPEMSLPQPSLNTPAPPPMPLTPKCVLRMDDEELQTPQMHDFGISEHTMCLNNDFTMDLFRKNTEKPQRQAQGMPAPPVNPLLESLQNKVQNLESPVPPVFCTPGLKIKKPKGDCALPSRGKVDPESPCGPADLPSTPDVPAFQTPYMNRLVSSKKSTRQHEPIKMRTDDDSENFDLPSPPRTGANSSKRTWEYNVPEISIMGVDDGEMPEMPNLESDLGNSLQSKNAKLRKKIDENATKGPTVKSLELDGPTQEFSLGTPHLRKEYDEPSTPEMPDLSSVTQDICKLLSEAQSRRSVMAVVHPNIRPEREKTSPLPPRAASLSVVSEREFQSLPSYLRQMTLSSLNQAISNINRCAAESQGQKTEIHMEELTRITSLGSRTLIYVLCLTELKRLTHVGGSRNDAVYKLTTHT